MVYEIQRLRCYLSRQQASSLLDIDMGYEGKHHQEPFSHRQDGGTVLSVQVSTVNSVTGLLVSTGPYTLSVTLMIIVKEAYLWKNRV